mmetsp:Transcript_241/g.310  ORF Transcript_241/g.310 Transcript_241/m.310 type:complete len:248 (+) Transcript_241:101-844(+)
MHVPFFTTCTFCVSPSLQLPLGEQILLKEASLNDAPSEVSPVHVGKGLRGGRHILVFEEDANCLIIRFSFELLYHTLLEFAILAGLLSRLFLQVLVHISSTDHVGQKKHAGRWQLRRRFGLLRLRLAHRRRRRLALHTLDDATRLLVSFLHDKRVHHTLTFFSKSSTILPTHLLHHFRGKILLLCWGCLAGLLSGSCLLAALFHFLFSFLAHPPSAKLIVVIRLGRVVFLIRIAEQTCNNWLAQRSC